MNNVYTFVPHYESKGLTDTRYREMLGVAPKPVQPENPGMIDFKDCPLAARYQYTGRTI